MKHPQSLVAVLCVWLAAAPQTPAQQVQPADQSGQPRSTQDAIKPDASTSDASTSNAIRDDATPRLESGNAHWYSRFQSAYLPRVLPPVNVSNSSRIDALLRAGNLYLSLQDAVELALENNLDIEVQRYEYAFADADLLRARSGASILGIPTSATTGVPTGVTGILGIPNSSSPGANSAAITSAPGILGNLNTGIASSPAASSLAPGASYDPTFMSTVQYGHITTPQQNTVTTGIASLISVSQTANFSVGQTFSTGGTVTLGYNNLNTSQNAFQNTFNPATTSNLDFSFTQPLLQGFGRALNTRTIKIAKNNLKAADYVFKQQVINVIANVSVLYWNLVYFNNDLDVKRKAIAVSTRLLNENKLQLQAGTLAPIAIAQAQAQVASDQQALVQSETNVLQQETLLKSTLSRNGLENPAIASARLIVTDRIQVPEVEAIDPYQVLVARALDNRPEVAQSRIQIDNSKLTMDGVRNQLLPQVNLTGDLRNNALAGPVNTEVNPATGLIPNHIADTFFIGGYGNILSQLFSRNFPNYTVGVQLIIPFRNRAAQANLITTELNLRQNELSVQRLINQVRVDVQTALTALTQARAQYQAAVQARILQEQTADAEEKKLAVGASTTYNVILIQRDMWAAQDAEVQAQALYILARVQLEWATGMTLQNHHIEMEEAKAGHVSRAPDPIPVR